MRSVLKDTKQDKTPRKNRGTLALDKRIPPPVDFCQVVGINLLEKFLKKAKFTPFYDGGRAFAGKKGGSRKIK